MEPLGGVGHQRGERGRGPEQTDQQALRRAEEPQVGRQPGGDIAGAKADRAEPDRYQHAEPIGKPAHQDAAEAEADHGQRVRQRRVGARHAELGLDGGSTTVTVYIPEPPMVISSSDAPSRIQA